MREFMITLRSGKRYTVKADRVVHNTRDLLLVNDRAGTDSKPDTEGDIIALFAREQVTMIVDRAQLVSEEKCDAFVVGTDDDCPIPF